MAKSRKSASDLRITASREQSEIASSLQRAQHIFNEAEQRKEGTTSKFIQADDLSKQADGLVESMDTAQKELQDLYKKQVDVQKGVSGA